MEKKVIMTELVVAGSGGTGLAAAYAAAKAGLKVIVLEKLQQIGGNTRISSGFFAINSREQKAAGLQLSKATAVQRLLNYNHFLANGPLIHKIVNSAAEALETLEQMGMKIKLNPTAATTQFAHREDDYKGGSYHMYQDKAQGYQKIQQTLERAGVEFKFGITMQELLSSEGQITGISAVNEAGERFEVHAQAVVVATGGFGGDKKRVATVMQTPYLRTIGVPNMGEGLDAMVKAGGKNIDATALIHAAQLAKSKITRKTSKQHLAGFAKNPLTQLLLTPLFWVNMNGERFTNEDVVYDTVEWANAGWSVGGQYYFVVDTATLNDFTEHGGKLEVSQAGPGADTTTGNFVELAEAAVKDGTAYKGNTLAELAQNAHFETAQFYEAVKKYNDSVQLRVDQQFGKSKKSLVYAIKKAPFYAFTTQVAHLGTIGGVRVDEHLRVLDAEMRPIPGLYTGGANAGGYYEGHSYPAYEGLASGFAWTSGRIAGLSAAKYVKNKQTLPSQPAKNVYK
ncbi:FAD-dependent oxidoreductase [Liquorilactobacillus satsumensis]|uniref:FAD-dependent oxidoreductase n=1 Tax=Liquorilactobacillus satsumensis TaxID=259059 RepID=UPI001E2D33C2|nr:FAD-dependent oxidoreductase [Liquorilactobacillus satsumensis]MCC7666780.1 reductase [Liquorilactobacillus satsumensis]MCP9328547.1 FAD-dependent oxidoreductase [Liquorilactobacillus satsumensis]MCP9358288.1 FAD-dependent oxidoreductase [Liquorilactobacillus satsumensis]MCP9372291.1 FAD-dependent oxidoreductase [Liquorilactobacillus satsumensis]